MSYATIEDGISAIIQTVSGFTSANVAQGDYRCLGAGVAQAVILMPGGFTRNMEASNYVRSVWSTNIELWIPWRGEQSTSSASIKTVRQNIIDKLDKYPTLNSVSGVVRARLVSAGKPETWQTGAKQFWKQVMVMEVEERTVVSYSE